MIFRKGHGKLKRTATSKDGAVATFIPRLPWRDSEFGRFERSIPRYQRVLFYALLAGIILMAFFLVYERTQARDRLAAQSDATPLSAPVSTDTESFTLDLANDADGSVTAVQRQFALPLEPSVRARALLERLVAEYALPKAQHPLTSGAAVDDVFLLKLPIVSPIPVSPIPVSPISVAPNSDTPNAAVTAEPADSGSDGEIAVINLRGSFVNDHPSGVQVEMLTVLSMIGTLHANFSQITQVKFLVDGQPKETLAGHVDLGRVYPAIDTTVTASQMQPAGGSQ